MNPDEREAAEEGSDWRISYEAPREMARIFEGGKFVAMKAIALASEEMHDDCSDRDVSQDGDVTGPNRMRRPRRTRWSGCNWRVHTKAPVTNAASV